MRTLLVAVTLVTAALPLSKVIHSASLVTANVPTLCADGPDEPLPLPLPKRA